MDMDTVVFNSWTCPYTLTTRIGCLGRCIFLAPASGLLYVYKYLIDVPTLVVGPIVLLEGQLRDLYIFSFLCTKAVFNFNNCLQNGGIKGSRLCGIATILSKAFRWFSHNLVGDDQNKITTVGAPPFCLLTWTASTLPSALRFFFCSLVNFFGGATAPGTSRTRNAFASVSQFTCLKEKAVYDGKFCQTALNRR